MKVISFLPIRKESCAGPPVIKKIVQMITTLPPNQFDNQMSWFFRALGQQKDNLLKLSKLNSLSSKENRFISLFFCKLHVGFSSI